MSRPVRNHAPTPLRLLPRRPVARCKLDEALFEGRLSPAYAAVICRTMYRCELDEANEEQLWRLVGTIKNRVEARTKKVAKLSEAFISGKDAIP